MILEILSVGLIVSACLALFLDEVEASVAALGRHIHFYSSIVRSKRSALRCNLPVRRWGRNFSYSFPLRRNAN